MLGWLSNMFRRDEVVADEIVPERRTPADAGPIQVRRWDGAATHRLNKEQFAAVTGRTINEDLVGHLRTLVDRCTYEATTNPTIEGMVDTHCIDILGPEGPSLQVLPKRPVGLSRQQLEDFASYCVEAEEYLEDWAEVCDYNEESSFFDVLELNIRAWWTTGNGFNQIVNTRTGSRGVGSIRLHPVHAQRVLQSFVYQTEDGHNICLGMKRDSWGKTEDYFVQEANDFGCFSGSMKFAPVPAREMIHDFKRVEPGQMAGIPLLSSALPDVGDLRQFDKLTIEAAKVAASQGIIFEDKFKDSPTIKGKANGGSYTAKLGLASLMHAPKGTEAKQIDPKHPASRYVEFSNEKYRTIGRPSQMPLMIARLNAQGLSYAAARIEAQLYQRGIRRDQARLRRRYAPLLMDVLREAELAGKIPFRPVPISIGASWARLPHVDPSKEAKARQVDLQTMSKSLLDVWAEEGKRPHVQVENLRRTIEALESVKPGLGNAYIVNLLTNTAPEIMDKFEELQDEMESSVSLSA